MLTLNSWEKLEEVAPEAFLKKLLAKLSMKFHEFEILRFKD